MLANRMPVLRFIVFLCGLEPDFMPSLSIRREQNMIAKPSQAEAAKRLNPLEIITLIFSVYVLIALLIQSLVPLPPDAIALLDWMD